MELRLTHDRIAVIPITDPDRYGKIIAPEEAKQRPDQGVVIYKGDSVSEVKVGDHVIFSGYAGNKVTLAEHGVYIMLKEKDIEAVLLHNSNPPSALYTHAQIERVSQQVEQDLTVLGRYSSESLEAFRARLISYLQSTTFAEGLEF
jgi:co-chaperonin GroES (HSP10)